MESNAFLHIFSSDLENMCTLDSSLWAMIRTERPYDVKKFKYCEKQAVSWPNSVENASCL